MKHFIFSVFLILVILSGCKQKLESKPEKAILSYIIGEVMLDGQPERYFLRIQIEHRYRKYIIGK